MSGFKIEGISGSLPRTDAHLLPDNHAQFANNAKLTSGALRSWQQPSLVFTPVKVAPISMYRLPHSSIDYWLTWNTDVNCISGPIAGDTTGKVFYTGDTTGSLAGPKKSNWILATNTGAGGDMPLDFLELGVPAPPSGFTVTPGAATAGTAVPRSYVITFVTTWGEESAPCATPTTVNLQPAQTAAITGLPAALAGKYSIQFVRVYKTLTSSTGVAAYQKLIDVNIGTTTGADNGVDTTLGVILPSQYLAGNVLVNWDTPPSDLSGLVAMPNGMGAAFSGNVLCFWEPGQPHAWPIAYRLTMDFNIVGIATTGQSLLVATTGAPYIVTGSHPLVMTMTKVQSKESCLSKRGVIDMGYGEMYPSLNGMVLHSAAGTDIVTEDFYTRDEWAPLNPASMIATKYDNKLIVFYKRVDATFGGFALNIHEKTHAELTYLITGIYNDPQNNILYVIHNNVIKQWDGDPLNLIPYDWKGKKRNELRPVNFGVAAVGADYDAIAATAARAATLAASKASNALLFAGDLGATLNDNQLNQYTVDGGVMIEINFTMLLDRFLQLIVYADGVQKFSKNLMDKIPFKLPSGFKTEDWEFELSGNVTCYWLKVGETMADLKKL